MKLPKFTEAERRRYLEEKITDFPQLCARIANLMLYDWLKKQKSRKNQKRKSPSYCYEIIGSHTKEVIGHCWGEEGKAEVLTEEPPGTRFKRISKAAYERATKDE